MPHPPNPAGTEVTAPAVQQQRRSIPWSGFSYLLSSGLWGVELGVADVTVHQVQAALCLLRDTQGRLQAESIATSRVLHSGGRVCIGPPRSS